MPVIIFGQEERARWARDGVTNSLGVRGGVKSTTLDITKKIYGTLDFIPHAFFGIPTKKAAGDR